MKRYYAIIFVLMYTMCTTGVSANLHFCGGSLAGISVFGQHDEKECCGNKAPSKKCCDNKTAYYKLTVSHTPAPKTAFPENIFTHIQCFNAAYTLPVTKAEILTSFLNVKTPFKEKHPPYLTNRVLLV